jgi:hypothetical protein
VVQQLYAQVGLKRLNQLGHGVGVHVQLRGSFYKTAGFDDA